MNDSLETALGAVLNVLQSCQENVEIDPIASVARLTSLLLRDSPTRKHLYKNVCKLYSPDLVEGLINVMCEGYPFAHIPLRLLSMLSVHEDFVQCASKAGLGGMLRSLLRGGRSDALWCLEFAQWIMASTSNQALQDLLLYTQRNGVSATLCLLIALGGEYQFSTDVRAILLEACLIVLPRVQLNDAKVLNALQTLLSAKHQSCGIVEQDKLRKIASYSHYMLTLPEMKTASKPAAPASRTRPPMRVILRDDRSK